jgi:large subunit ribosomal protein L1
VPAGKRYRAIRAHVRPGHKYPVEDGLSLLAQTATAKFDETIDVAIRLGVDPKQSDQMVRGALSLPHGTGKTVRILVFAEGDAARAATAAGADYVGGDDLIEKIQREGWTDFDKAIATRNLMAKVGRLGKILGPRGLMPNPKTGTVVGPEEVAQTIQEVKGGRVDFRVEKAGVVHAPIGKASMGTDKIRENLMAFVQNILRLKPASSKGTYLRGVSVSSTMGPGIRLDVNEIVRATGETR